MRARAAAPLLALLLTACSVQQDVAVQQQSGPRTGAMAAPLGGTTLEGPLLTAPVGRGQVVVADFWASWCGPCRAQQVHLDALAQRYTPRGVAFVGVDVRDDAANARAYLEQQHVPYPSLADADGSLAAAYAVLAPPTTVVVDRSGRVAHTYFGGVTESELGPVLDALLG